MKHQNKVSRWRRVIAGALGALLCVAGSELLVCSVKDPALFDKLTEPVVSAAGAVKRVISSGTDELAKLFTRAESSEEHESVTTQIAEAPVAKSQMPEELSVQKDETAESAPDRGADELRPESQISTEPTIWQKLDATDESVTRFIERDGQSVLTGGTADLIYFNQGEAPWAETMYGSDRIDAFGCGPTAMAIVVSSLTDQIISPADMAQWAVDNEQWAYKSGSMLSIVEKTAESFGLQAQSFQNCTPEALQRELLAGNMLVALMTDGHFTQSGHFIILRGVTLEGGILVADPNSRERSLAVWDAQLILDELSDSEKDGAPLWLITTGK